MADYVHPPGKGSLRYQENKTHEKGPDWKGKLVLDRDYQAGDTIRIAGWDRSFDWGKVVNLSVSNMPSEKKGEQQYPKEVSRRDGGDVPW